MTNKISKSKSGRILLWGHLKSAIYKIQPADIDDLKRQITVDRSLLFKVFENILYYCLERNGEYFEQFTK